jgi:hypothetical protein
MTPGPRLNCMGLAAAGTNAFAALAQVHFPAVPACRCLDCAVLPRLGILRALVNCGLRLDSVAASGRTLRCLSPP